ILWPGRCTNFAQSSGTSDGKSKYIPVTPDSFSSNHYRGGSDVVSFYLRAYPDSRIFSGKAFLLGGSLANELAIPKGVCVGDLSANLIDHINPAANLVRIPSKQVALMADWTRKLPALIESSLHQDVTNISGVPSWFLTVLKGVIERAGATTIHDVWPHLEVFFHGGIAFGPYREQYRHITDPSRMRYLETYNASEGFFAVQNDPTDPAMLLLLDEGVFYEFVPIDQAGEEYPEALPAWQVEQGKVYALLITAPNGLWRFPIGDTVRIESVNPLKITIAGRTRHYINAFGEEVMVYNTDRALIAASQATGAQPLNYTAAPVFAGDHSRGRHQWIIEFSQAPADLAQFAQELDKALQNENSDYQAKRTGNIFLDPLEVIPAPAGTFDRWLASTGKLGGQRKVPRLSNDRTLIDSILQFL
ncbi:MAG: GH3 auxin-responsive promoter family protein, partial [Muribaculaceae bacterium]|nr:GH3 auxin-responsive promoter family protein [Muribaculaceae bacterium]